LVKPSQFLLSIRVLLAASGRFVSPGK